MLEYNNILNYLNFNVENRKVKLMNYYNEIKGVIGFIVLFFASYMKVGIELWTNNKFKMVVKKTILTILMPFLEITKCENELKKIL